eukprot:3359580-Pleurochrysis_carterae.AAC.5
MEVPMGITGDTPLLVAAKDNDMTTLFSLIQKGANINAVDNWGRTALIWAARLGLYDTTAMLIEAGADLEIKDKSGSNAYEWAAEMGHDSCAKSLLDAGSPFMKTFENGNAALKMSRISPEHELKKAFEMERKEGGGWGKNVKSV